MVLKREVGLFYGLHIYNIAEYIKESKKMYERGDYNERKKEI